MGRRSGRTVFWVGFLIYIVSFFLSFVGGRGVYTPKQPSGSDTFLEDAPIGNVSITISGLVNPAFLLAVIFLLVGKTPQLSRALRYVILLMLPFCWVVFADQHVYPREGYFLWTSGMLLVLFSSELEKRRPAVVSASA